MYLVLAAVDARPIADDWWFISDARHWGFGTYMRVNLGSSGRFSQFALAWLSSKLFGAAAVNVLPLALLVLAVGSAAWAIRRAAKLIAARVTHIDATLLAVLAVVSVVATAPSLYDTIDWFAASVAYLAGAVTALVVAGLYVGFLATREPPSFWATAGVALLAAVAGGFHELVGVTLTLAGLLTILTARDLRRSSARNRLLARLGVTTLGAALGTAANLLGPGAQDRARAQGAHVSLVAAVRTALHNMSFLRSDVRNGVLLLAFATGVVTWQLFGSVRQRRARRWLYVWTAFLLIVPWSVTAALTAWAGSTESGDRSPFRAAFLGTGSVAVAIVLGTWAVLSSYPSVLSQLRAGLLAFVLAVAGTIGFAHAANPILRAESIRARVVDARSASIKHQLGEGRKTIKVSPAPLLTVFTQAYDLSFVTTDSQRSGWLSAVRQYYGIPTGDPVTVVARQPRSYCLPGVTAPWVGVQSCEELHARR